MTDAAGRWQIDEVTPGPVQVTATDTSLNLAQVTWNLNPKQKLTDLRLQVLPRQIGAPQVGVASAE